MMKKIKIFHSKVRLLIALFLSIILLVIIIAQFTHFVNKYIDVLFCILLVIAIAFNLKRLLKPAVIFDSDKIIFPLTNEIVYWENIDTITFYNNRNVNESIEIKVKQVDKNRKKRKAPLVFSDYGENIYQDLSLYRIDLENFKINNEQFYLTMLALSKNNKEERAIEICNYKV